MFVSYAAQLEAKQQRVARSLSALGFEGQLKPMLASPHELGYRNRTQVKSDGQSIGYVTGAAKAIAPVDDCLVLSEHNRQTLQHLKRQLPNKAWRPLRGSPWTTLEFDDDLPANQVEPGVKRPFMQGNSAQNDVMRSWLRDTLAKINDKAQLLELFAGSGNFTEIAAESGCTDVVAVDSFSPGIDTLRQRQIPGVQTRTLNLFNSDAAETLSSELARADVLLLDPPRDGLRSLAEFLRLAKNLNTLIYLSCDLATYTRDIQCALAAGFVFAEVQALDLFPQTPHVEILSLLRRDPTQH